MSPIKKQVLPKDDISSEIILVTPALASAWLADNKFDNRRLDDRNVDKLARDIKAGKWVFDGNPIRFDKKGNILDGQHRLWAVVTSGKPIKSAVIKGLEDQSKYTIDMGKARSNADIFHFAGYTSTTVIVSCCRLSIGWKETNGDMWKWGMQNSHKRITPQELLEEAASNPKIANAVAATQSTRFTKKLFGPGLSSFIYYILSSSHKNISHVDYFFNGLEKGDGLSLDNPILILRNTLSIRENDMARKHGGNKSIAYRLALIIKAWNASLEGRKIERLIFNPFKESYPVIK